MARCRQLLQENEDIAKMVSSGRLAKLEGELAMHKKLVEEMKKNQVETDDFVQELDEDMVILTHDDGNDRFLSPCFRTGGNAVNHLPTATAAKRIEGTGHIPSEPAERVSRNSGRSGA